MKNGDLGSNFSFWNSISGQSAEILAVSRQISTYIQAKSPMRLSSFTVHWDTLPAGIVVLQRSLKPLSVKILHVWSSGPQLTARYHLQQLAPSVSLETFQKLKYQCFIFLFRRKIQICNTPLLEIRNDTISIFLWSVEK